MWIFDVGSRAFTRLTALGDASMVVWTPDGRHVVFTRGRIGQRKNPGVWRQSIDGDQPAEMLFAGREGENIDGGDVTSDGRGVLFCRGNDTDLVANAQLFYLPLAGDRTPEPVLKEPFGVTCEARVSPDGKWLAYTSSEGSTSTIYVRPFRRPGGRTKVSDGTAWLPLWSRDGSRLYYARSEDGTARGSVFAVRLNRSGDQAKVVSREAIAPIPANGLYAIGPDDRRILTLQLSESRVSLVVTTNWFPELRARLAGTK